MTFLAAASAAAAAAAAACRSCSRDCITVPYMCSSRDATLSLLLPLLPGPGAPLPAAAASKVPALPAVCIQRSSSCQLLVHVQRPPDSALPHMRQRVQLAGKSETATEMQPGGFLLAHLPQHRVVRLQLLVRLELQLHCCSQLVDSRLKHA